MALSATEKQPIIGQFKRGDNDTGSVEVQVALLTEDIKKLTEHFKDNKHDYHSRRGLMGKVSRRRKLLKYIKNQNIERYRALIEKLQLRDAV